jgi:hypothetical protein
MVCSRVSRTAAIFILLVCLAAPVALAQQTGAITGRVTTTDGDPLPGVTVEARSERLPQVRVTTTSVSGDYRLPALPPGAITIDFTLAGLQTVSRSVQVLLNQETRVNVSMRVAGVAETITVVGSALIDTSSTEIKSAVDVTAIEQIPTGQEYRDLVKLAPGVQVTDAEVRGPAAGGSGQDNVYQFDGVNVTLPLFGTLAAEPSSHDIEQVSYVKGGARAIDFNRAGGMTIDSISKSGTSQWGGMVQYQIQTDSMVADLDRTVVSRFDESRDWLTANFGGPLLADRLFFYGSYYRPTRDRENRANAYGEVPDFKSTRDEFFGKLTFTPTGNILLSGSYRDSSREDENAAIGAFSAATAATNNASDQTIAILEGSWIINDRSFATFKFNDYSLETAGLPRFLSSAVPSAALGAQLDLNNLNQIGFFRVPCPTGRAAGEPCTNAFGADNAHNAFIAPFINQYGYPHATGLPAGGGAVGFHNQINEQDFYRQSFEVAYDISFGGNVTHDLHFGFQQYTDEEDLARASNGWGIIDVLGGNTNCPANTQCAGQPAFFLSTFQRSTQAAVGRQVIHSEFKSQNFEINDTIRWGDWAFNVGALISNDTLYGQGLREDSSTISGYVSAPGNKYKMYEIPWKRQLQPRLGVTWAYNGIDNVYASYARYNPAASSLPRAASWDRNTLGLVTEAYFDANGVLIGSRQLASSSGKLFVDDMDPRYTDEYMIGTSQQFTPRIAGRVYARHRYSSNFWEDTNNNARVNFEPPPHIRRELYIPDLSQKLSQIGSGSTYVIAILDDAFTKYYEATLEGDWRVTDNSFLRGSYTWSQYYGNFDQDNTSTVFDFATFIGSSNLADGAGRQTWDNKYGYLHADRRHQVKLYGYQRLPWNATVGAFGLYQSGHAWEAWSWEPYRHLTTSTSAVNRYAEPAGSRRSPSHYQVDLNYTQNIPLGGLNLQLIGDMYNLTDKQTGYSPQPNLHSAAFGDPRLFASPRRYNIAARLQF